MPSHLGGNLPPLAWVPGTPEAERDRAAKYVLTFAEGAADALLLLETLGIDPHQIGMSPRDKPRQAENEVPRKKYR